MTTTTTLQTVAVLGRASALIARGWCQNHYTLADAAAAVRAEIVATGMGGTWLANPGRGDATPHPDCPIARRIAAAGGAT